MGEYISSFIYRFVSYAGIELAIRHDSIAIHDLWVMIIGNLLNDVAKESVGVLERWSVGVLEFMNHDG